MESKDLIEYATRPWEAIEEADAEHWVARKRRLGPLEGIRVAWELWASARVLRPDKPTPADREADLEVHRRVSEALRSVSTTPSP